MSHHPHCPTMIHAAWCKCTECDRPVPSVAEPSLLWTALEMVAWLAFGLLNAWLVKLIIGGPGLHVMLGLPA